MCSPVFIFVQANPCELHFHDIRPRQYPLVRRESVVTVAVVLLATALVIVIALLAAAGAGKLARIDGATYSAALILAATTFAAVITLTATVASVIAVFLI